MARLRKRRRDEDESEDSRGPQPQKRVKRPAEARDHKSSATKSTRRDTDTVSVGDSQEISHSQTRRLVDEKLSASKASATFSAEFRLKVEHDRAELRELLNAKVRDCKNNTAYKKQVRDLLSKEVPELEPAIMKLKEYVDAHGDKSLSLEQRRQASQIKDKASFYPLSIAAKQCLDASRSLISQYESLNNETQKQHLNVLEDMKINWKQDRETLASLLEKGKLVSEMRIKHLLPHSEHEKRISSSSDLPITESAGEASQFFPQHQTASSKLRSTFQQAARGVSRMVHEIPKYE